MKIAKEQKSLMMEAVEIKTEPLDEYFNQIIHQDVIIKSEDDIDVPISKEEYQMVEPLVQIGGELIQPKEEPIEEQDQSVFDDHDDPHPDETLNLPLPPPPPVTNQCDFCSMFFKSRTSLKLHERNCTYKNHCKTCGQTFVTSYALKIHTDKMHNPFSFNKEPSEKRPIGRPPRTAVSLGARCDVCNLTFANSRDLNNHKKKHNKCQHCGEYFKLSEDLRMHLCDNLVIKKEVENETETPTKQIFQATNSMVVIPVNGSNVQKRKQHEYSGNAKKKWRSLSFVADTDHIKTESESSSKSSSIITKGTDFEAFAQQMMKGLTDISEPFTKPNGIEPISDKILKKIQASANTGSQGVEKDKDFINSGPETANADTTETCTTIADSQGTTFQLRKENSVCPSAIIKEEPIEYESYKPLNLPKMPSPLPYIKHEPKENQSDNHNTVDFTDFLLQELIDRKAKSIAKERQAKNVTNQLLGQQNVLGFKVKKDIAGLKTDAKRPQNQVSRTMTPASRTKTPASKSNVTKLPTRQYRRRNPPSKNNFLFKKIQEGMINGQPPTFPSDQKLLEVLTPSTQFISLNEIINKNRPSKEHEGYDDINAMDFLTITTDNIHDENTVHVEISSTPVENSMTNETTSTEHTEKSKSKPRNPEPLVDGAFDFEEVIQSTAVPNFLNAHNVIKTLTEEYRKAEKVNLKSENVILREENNQPLKEPPKLSIPNNKPCSLFFPILEDTSDYNMTAGNLNENYRYLWICPLCPRTYIQVHAFQKHLLTAHIKEESELKKTKFELRPELVCKSDDDSFCNLCHVTLADRATLEKHQEELHDEKDIRLANGMKRVHRCYICSKTCVSRSSLAVHMNSNCGKNPQYECNVCGKKFHTKSTLSLHKTMHTGELPHACSFCQKRFRTRGQLTVHTRTHTGEKPFPCKVCSQRFTHRETLIAHLSRHIDMKRYKCYGCETFFSCISGLKTHRMTRPETCGRIELNARAVGPRVRVIKGNVIFEPQPIYNARLANKGGEKNMDLIYQICLDHNYFVKHPQNRGYWNMPDPKNKEPDNIELAQMS